MDDVRLIRVGVPGPPGTGVTAEELLQIQSDLAALKSGTWRGTPKIRGRSLPQADYGASTTLTNLPGMPFLTLSGLNAAIAHRIEMVGQVKVQTPSNVVVSVAATLGSVGSGALEDTPNATGTFWVSCAGVWTFGSGITSVTAYLSYQVASAVTVAFLEAHLELRVTPRTD